MPGIQINSLQDLLMLRELKNQANPTYSAMQALSQGVAEGIAQQQEDARARKKEEESYAKGLKQFDKFLGSNSNKDRLIKKASFDPLTGKTKLSYSLPTESEKKTIREEALAIKQSEIKKAFNEPGSNLTIVDLINSGIKPSEAEKMEELRIPINNARNEIREVYNKAVSNYEPLTGSVNRIESDIAIPRRTSSGRAKELVDIGEETRIGEAEANVQVDKEVASQKQKAGELAERDFLRASGAADTAMQGAIEFADEQFKKFGVKPGDYLGLFDKLTPKQLNKFKAGFVGAGKEGAALIARQIIPGVRAANITEIFARSVAEIGNTIEGNAANTAFSMANAFVNVLSQNIKVFDENSGKRVNILDMTIDPTTGVPISQLGILEQSKAINKIKNDFRVKLEDGLVNSVYSRNPNLLQPETVRKIRSSMSDDDILTRIDELKSKMRGDL